MRNGKRGNGEWNGVTVSRGRAFLNYTKKISYIVLLHLETVIFAWGLYGRAISSISLYRYDFKVAEYADARLHVGPLPLL